MKAGIGYRMLVFASHDVRSLFQPALLATLVVLLLSAVAAPAAQQPAAAAPYRQGTVLAGFKAGIPASSQKAAIAATGAVEIKLLEPGVHVLAVRAGTEAAAIQALQARPEIRYAEPDYLQHADGAPNDPFFDLQWALQNTGQSVNGTTGTPGADERTAAAWNVITGSASVVVAVVDTGIDYTHPDLAPNVWNNPGGVNGCAAGTHGYNVLAGTCNPMDDDTQYGGHGTHVSGIIGAAGDNAVGVSGVNWTTSIMGVKWINSSGTGATSDLITALNWVINAKKAGVNVRVVNDSATWAGTAASQALSDTIDLLGSNDILFLSASGNTAQNNDTTPRYPCVYDRPTQVCVAASDQTDHLWSSANWGDTTVDMAAPGVNIYSTLRNGTYGFISGGSMACAQVSGAAALILSTGYQSVANLKADILNNVDVLAALSGLVRTSGRLNVCKAIPGCGAAPTAPPASTSAPVVSGTAQQGQTLSASVGTWSGGPTSYAYQWNRCNSAGAGCAAITGATAPTYTLMAAADIGATINVTVTASNSIGSGSATSATTGVVSSAPAVSWNVTSSIQNGQTLCAKVQWQAFPSTTSISAVEFYIDGTQTWTAYQSPYYYNGANNYLDTSTLSPGSHVFAVKAIGTDASVAYASALATVGCSSGTGIRLVQSASIQGTGGKSVSLNFPNSNAAGNLILAFVRMSSTSQTVTLADTAGNIYTDAVGQVQTTDGHQIHLFYAKNVAGGTNTVTATFSGSNNHPWLAVLEYSGLSTSGPLDKTAHAQGNGNTVNSGPTAVTAAANELVFAATGMQASWSGQITAGSGYTLVQQNPGSSTAAAEQQVVSATGSYSGVFALSSSANWSAVVATFSADAIVSSPAITTTSLPNGTANSAYSATLAATGGVTPYSWSVISGSLPAGLTLGPSTGVISGTPTTAGTSSFTVQVTDANAKTASAALGITINPAGSTPAIALVQSNAVQGSGVSSVSQAFAGSNTAGNLIVAFVRMSSTSQTVTVSDSAGNAYATAVSQAQTTDGHQAFIFYASNIKAGPNTVTAHFSSTNNHPWLAIYEYSGVSALDQTARAQGGSSTAACGPTATTSAASELLFAGLGLPSSTSASVTSGSGYTLELQNAIQSGSRAATEDRLVTTTGGFTGAFTLSGSANWSCVLATFR